MELESFVTLAVRLHYLREDEVAESSTAIVSLSKMLTALRRSIHTKAIVH
jgi:hypothetical protein